MKKSSISTKLTSISLISLLSLGLGAITPDYGNAGHNQPRMQVNNHHGGGGGHHGGGGGGHSHGGGGGGHSHGGGGGGHPHGGGGDRPHPGPQPFNPGHHHHRPPPFHPGHHHHGPDGLFPGFLTGLVVGSIINAASMPSDCRDAVYDDINYRQCGDTWYRPQHYGTSLQYQIVDPPY